VWGGVGRQWLGIDMGKEFHEGGRVEYDGEGRGVGRDP